ncbi:FkbM family methyltransferase [Pseudopontixanthobacter vadosimaris]|uniref:FkbM family methyltransferase n=1 Tax=Pseudopontixanthobacter vadosimaris TaxID=2726450 RepID=UPI001474EBCA|nr:FkbM family methyltransferase [Pseudopontixanthobacter vadosimaris]
MDGGLLARREKRLLNKAFGLLDPDRAGIALIDIGAAGAMPSRFAAVRDHVHYVGFEPDARSRAALLARPQPCLSYEILPHAIGAAQGEVAFHLCRKGEVSSTFRPDREFLDRFPDPARFDIMDTASLPVISLDDAGIGRCDFLKADIQGGELDALRAGVRLLESCFGLELEVEFQPLYAGQPLFCDVAKFAAAQGFALVDFVDLTRWTRKSDAVSRKELGTERFGQLVAGDALFLKMPEKILADRHDQAALRRYLAVLLVYRRNDLLLWMLAHLPEEEAFASDALADLCRQLTRIVRHIDRTQRLAKRLTLGTAAAYRYHLFY